MISKDIQYVILCDYLPTKWFEKTNQIGFLGRPMFLLNIQGKVVKTLLYLVEFIAWGKTVVLRKETNVISTENIKISHVCKCGQVFVDKGNRLHFFSILPPKKIK